MLVQLTPPVTLSILLHKLQHRDTFKIEQVREAEFLTFFSWHPCFGF